MKVVELTVHSTGHSSEFALSKADHAALKPLGVENLILAFDTLDVQVRCSSSKVYLSAPKECWKKGHLIKCLTQHQLCDELKLKVGDKIAFYVIEAAYGLCLESIEHRETDYNDESASTRYTKVLSRPRQKVFRNSLLEIYKGKCAVTVCDADKALEAAHIIPYSERASINPRHGILLRSDIHKLFDAYQLSINPTNGMVEVDVALEYYKELSGRKVHLLPDLEFLKVHYQRFTENSC